MTVSFLFIVIILLAFFASQFNDEDKVPRSQLDEMRNQRDAALTDLVAANTEIKRLLALLNEMQEQRDGALKKLTEANKEIQRLLKLQKRDPLEAYIARAAAARLKILEDLRASLLIDFPNMMIEISAESDALRFQGEGLFETGRSDLKPEPRQIVETIAERLDTILPCYTLGPASSWGRGCNPGHAIIEAVQIEGHTDSQGKKINNLTLSTNRANATFAAMIERTPKLDEHLNYRNQPVMSVAGYGEMRPVATNGTVEGRSTNRRIDLRIIMYSPALSTEIELIRRRLQAD
jgi:flagellar motor protein MotB